MLDGTTGGVYESCKYVYIVLKVLLSESIVSQIWVYFSKYYRPLWSWSALQIRVVPNIFHTSMLAHATWKQMIKNIMEQAPLDQVEL